MSAIGRTSNFQQRAKSLMKGLAESGPLDQRCQAVRDTLVTLANDFHSRPESRLATLTLVAGQKASSKVRQEDIYRTGLGRRRRTGCFRCFPGRLGPEVRN